MELNHILKCTQDIIKDVENILKHTRDNPVNAHSMRQAAENILLQVIEIEETVREIKEN